jgi:predicted porin
MKKTALALVIASALPLSALAEVTVYGKANVSLQNADEADESALELVSNASRIGLKGGETINDGLKVIYQFEYQTEVDDGVGSNGQTFSQRNIYVGLQGTGGTVIGGQFDTPVKAAQEKIDLFNDLEGDINYIVLGDVRAKNIVQYTTPASFGAFAGNVAYVSVENPDLDDGISASFTYTTPALYAALALEQDVTAQGLDLLRLVGRYTFAQFQLGALYEQGSIDETDTDGWVVSAKYSATDALAFKLQYGDGVVDDDIDEITGDSLSLGVDYMLSKNTTLFAYYTQEGAEENSVELKDDNWLGVGIDFKF